MGPDRRPGRRAGPARGIGGSANGVQWHGRGIGALRALLRGLAIAAAASVLAVAAHFALIEVGREVATLRTPRPDGSWQETRLWIVDDGETAWLHSAGAAWAKRFEAKPIVEVEREGRTRRYRATPVPGPHPEVHRLLREKYGIADRWVRFIGPDGDTVLAVRLDPVP